MFLDFWRHRTMRSSIGLRSGAIEGLNNEAK
jgi:hypothetical protein